MNEMLVAVFDTEDAAVKGMQALKGLHEEGGISLYAWAVITKELDGRISVKQQSGEALVGTALGLLMGGIIGILGGPAGSAVGASIGGYVGLLADWARSGIDLKFLDDVSKTLEIGKAAVLAEIEQSWCPLLEPRLRQQGGTVFRRFRTDVIDDQLLQEEMTLQAALQGLIDDLDEVDAASRQDVKKSIADVRQQLVALHDRANAAIDQKKAEADLKISTLRAQAQTAAKEAKGQIEGRMLKAQADFDMRVQKLNQARALAKKALGPQADFDEPPGSVLE